MFFSIIGAHIRVKIPPSHKKFLERIKNIIKIFLQGVFLYDY